MQARVVLSLLGQRAGYRRLWAAEALSYVGDWFSLVAVSVLSLGSGPNGVLALALTLTAHLLPQALLAPLAGWLADRVDRRSVLVVASCIEGLLTISMLLAANAKAIGLVQVLLLLRASTSAMRPPASGAALPVLVERAEIAPANALNAVTWSASFAIGMALGGVATEVSPLLALGIDACTFFVAALTLSGLPALPPHAAAQAESSGALARIAGELGEALRLGTGPALRKAVFGKMPLAFAAGSAWIGLNIVASAHPDLGGEALTLGGLQGLRGIGTGVGPVIALAVIARGWRRQRVEHGAVVGALIGIAAVGLVPGGVVVFAAALVWGAGAGANWVLTTTRIQERGPAPFLGRLLALDALLYAVAMSAGALLTAISIESGVTLGVSSLAAALGGAAGWTLLSSSREIGESVEPAPVSRAH